MPTTAPLPRLRPPNPAQSLFSCSLARRWLCRRGRWWCGTALSLLHLLPGTPCPWRAKQSNELIFLFEYLKNTLKLLVITFMASCGCPLVLLLMTFSVLIEIMWSRDGGESTESLGVRRAVGAFLLEGRQMRALLRSERCLLHQIQQT